MVGNDQNKSPVHIPETVAVIGSGLAGSMAAIFLAKSGYKVLLIERQDRPMMVSSKIPIHLHAGGLYTGETAAHCLHDSINFRLALPFAVTERPTAFAVMTLDDTNKKTSGMTQLEEEARSIYIKETKITISNLSELSEVQGNLYKRKAQEKQQEKWSAMKGRFADLKSKYQQAVDKDETQQVYGPPSEFYKVYETAHFQELHDNAQIMTDDPKLNDKDGWTSQLARVSDPTQVLGVVMSSEVGLNMMRAGVGIELELESLKANGQLEFLTETSVSKVERTNNGMMSLNLTRVNEPNLNVTVTQVVNATGYRGKEIDMQMEVQTDWSVDVKGAGVIQVDKEFNHVPGVFFTEGVGMAHLSRFNDTMAGINYCDPEVEATYVKDGQVTYQPGEQLGEKPRLAELEKEIIYQSISAPALIERTQRDINSSARFLPGLPKHAEAKGYVAGALGIIGGLQSRESKEVYHSDRGYHAINLAKGGGAVSAAMALVNNVESHSINMGFRNESSRHFSHGSHSQLSESFQLQLTTERLTVKAEKRAQDMGAPIEIARPYHH